MLPHNKLERLSLESNLRQVQKEAFYRISGAKGRIRCPWVGLGGLGWVRVGLGGPEGTFVGLDIFV
jgi:hypothetical protein